MEKVLLLIISFSFILERILDFLNYKHWKPQVPAEMQGILSNEKYLKSHEYAGVNYRFEQVVASLSFLILFSMIFFHGFGYIDSLVRTWTEASTWQSLLFFGVLAFASDFISLPFDIYKTFVIEQRFGFNKSTPLVFFQDKLKGYVLTIFIGGGVLSVLLLLLEKMGAYFAPVAVLFLAFFLIVFSMFFTSLILPLFNKLTPLPEGELRNAIQDYSSGNQFPLNEIMIMDGSKRSSKANAFFSGLGRKKTIVLYDTLVNQHSTEELVAVLAHEIGHYKLKHTLSGLLRSVIFLLVMLSAFQWIIGQPELFLALGANQSSFHIDLLAFAILFTPLSALTGIFMNFFSRRNEFDADAFAAKTYAGEPLITALKKLSVDQLSNLSPHPAYVFFHYSHPPLLKRIERIRMSV